MGEVHIFTPFQFAVLWAAAALLMVADLLGVLLEWWPQTSITFYLALFALVALNVISGYEYLQNKVLSD